MSLKFENPTVELHGFRHAIHTDDHSVEPKMVNAHTVYLPAWTDAIAKKNLANGLAVKL
jgi:hypothetical protein